MEQQTTHVTQCTPAFLLLSCTAPVGRNCVAHVRCMVLTSARIRDTATSISPTFSWGTDIPITSSSSALTSFSNSDHRTGGTSGPVVWRFANLNGFLVVVVVRTPTLVPHSPGAQRLPPTSFPSIVVTNRRWLCLAWSCHSMAKD